MSARSVLLLATLDTKGREAEFVRAEMRVFDSEAPAREWLGKK